MVLKLFSTARKYWKTSIFLSGACAWGYSAGSKYYNDFQLMRVLCDEAKVYGKEAIPALSKNKHVTVILNPTANDGKSKKMFERWSAPLLHLAGYKVSVVNTERSGQATDYMEIMSNTDAVLVAGGDGTFNEVITGMMRRNDRDEFSNSVSLGIVPLGKQNSVLSHLIPCLDNKLSSRPLIMKSTMALIRNHNQLCDILEIENIENKKKVYALSGLWFGSLRDTQECLKDYWYLGGLKSYYVYIKNALRGRMESRPVQLDYIEPCSGCANCYVEEKTPDLGNKTRWWHSFIKHSPVSPGYKPKPSYVNPACSEIHHVNYNTISLRIQLLPWGNFTSEKPAFVISTGPGDNKRSTFIKEGTRLAKGHLEHVVEHVYARQATIQPPTTDDDLWYSIDNEKFEAKGAKFTILPKKIRINLPPT